MSVTMHENTDVFAYLEGLEGRVLFLHGCNAKGVMGAGVAREVKRRWPGVFRVYRTMCQSVANPALLLGEVELVRAGEGIWVANAITQELYGRPSYIWADPDAIQRALAYLVELVEGEGFEHFVTVPVGCGLGGLKWEERAYTDKPPVRQLFEASPLDWQVCRL